MKPHETRSVADLVVATDAGARPKYLFFWSHRTAKDNPLTGACLSQWYPAPFCVDERVYPTAEHFMMAAKARLFGDQDRLDQILAVPSPGAAKALGRAVQGYDEAIWAANRYEIVVSGNYEKFRQHPTLLAFLLATKKRVLVEASPTDRIWGIGLSADDSDAENPQAWRGLNLLGFALMEVRGRLMVEPG